MDNEEAAEFMAMCYMNVVSRMTFEEYQTAVADIKARTEIVKTPFGDIKILHRRKFAGEV